jgi:HNH endonuclease
MRSLAMRQHTYPSSGRCVFCRAELPPDALTDEHIIPLSLNGSLVIRKGTCEPCRKRSNEKYEWAALDNDLLAPRRLLALRRRRGRNKKAPTALPSVTLGDATMDRDAKFEVELTTEQYPNYFSLILFPPAGLLVGIDRGSEIKELRLQIFDLGNRSGRVTNVTKREPYINGPFALMLSKMAYCFAVAELGLDGFDGDKIRDLLAGRRDDVYNFVGAVQVPERLTNRHLHGLYFRNRGKWLTVLVHLFASCVADERQPAIPYEVVVGETK